MRLFTKVAMSAAVAAVSLSALAACSSLSPQEALVAAVRSTDTAGSAAIDGNITMKSAGQTIDMTMNGVVNFDGSGGDLTMKMPSMNVNIDERIVSKTLYMKMDMPSLPSALTKKWFKLSLSDIIKDPAMLKKLGAGGLPNFSKTFKALEGATGVTKSAATVTVNGETYTVYNVSLTGANMLKQIEGISGSLGSAIASAAKDLSKAKVNATVYVNSANQLAREVVHVSVPIQGQTVDEVADISFKKIGQKVDIQAPPASDVIDFANMLGSLGSSGN